LSLGSFYPDRWSRVTLCCQMFFHQKLS
jgi:hypothetical protein